jgi:hypothetical protein
MHTNVSHYGRAVRGQCLKKVRIFTIEPMRLGRSETKILKDD